MSYPKLRTVLASQWGYYGSTPSSSSFAIQALVTHHFRWGAFYPVGNWSWIFSRRLADYGGVPLAVTEWNQKCWEVGATTPIPVGNPGFEDGNTSWSFWQRFPNAGARESVTEQAHTGSRSMKVTLSRSTGNPYDTVQASQEVAMPTPGQRLLRARAWVKSSPSLAKYTIA